MSQLICGKKKVTLTERVGDNCLAVWSCKKSRFLAAVGRVGECWTKKDQQRLHSITVISPVREAKSRRLLCLFEALRAERMAPVLLAPNSCPLLHLSVSSPYICLSVHPCPLSQAATVPAQRSWGLDVPGEFNSARRYPALPSSLTYWIICHSAFSFINGTTYPWKSCH